MHVLKFDENHNSPMRKVFYLSGNNEKCVGHAAKIILRACSLGQNELEAHIISL